jgi:hypothetical protein
MEPPEAWQVVTVNEVLLAGTLKEGTPFEVHIEARMPKTLRNQYFGASTQPELVIAEITVRLGGQKIPFPKEGFEDLARPRLQTVSLTSQPSGTVKLRFTGGEESAAYEAEYLIQPNRLAERAVSYFEVTAGGEKARIVKTTTLNG